MAVICTRIISSSYSAAGSSTLYGLVYVPVPVRTTLLPSGCRTSSPSSLTIRLVTPNSALPDFVSLNFALGVIASPSCPLETSTVAVLSSSVADAYSQGDHLCSCHHRIHSYE